MYLATKIKKLFPTDLKPCNLSIYFQSAILSDQTSNDNGGGGNNPETNNAVEPSTDQLAMESAERDTPSHAYNGPPPPVPPQHNRRQNPPHLQPHHALGNVRTYTFKNSRNNSCKLRLGYKIISLNLGS